MDERLFTIFLIEILKKHSFSYIFFYLYIKFFSIKTGRLIIYIIKILIQFYEIPKKNYASSIPIFEKDEGRNRGKFRRESRSINRIVINRGKTIRSTSRHSSRVRDPNNSTMAPRTSPFALQIQPGTRPRRSLGNMREQPRCHRFCLAFKRSRGRDGVSSHRGIRAQLRGGKEKGK